MYLPLPREWSRRVALIFIALGILLMPDIIAPTPFMDMVLNVPFAMVLADFLNMEYLNAFVLTYIISFVLIAVGLLIYPYNTIRLISGRLHAAIRFMLANPVFLLISIITIVIVYMMGQWAYDNLYEYAKEVIVSGIT
jgi:hypothetical protein